MKAVKTRRAVEARKESNVRDTFSTYHPIITFSYFCGVILFSMILLHPVFLCVSFVAALGYALFLNGWRSLRFTFLYLIPMMVVAAAINPLFNHRGVTILGYFFDNPITQESIYYGIAVGVMFGAVILWFSCFNIVMTADKIMYIFGRLLPSISLVFSMVLRFVPKSKARLTEVIRSQSCAGRDVRSGPWGERARNGIRILSIMTSWILESSIDTADSMKARGYGLPGRTSYSIYRFDARDKAGLLVLVLIFLSLGAGIATGSVAVNYFPSFLISVDPRFGSLLYGLYLIFCFAPLALNVWEAAKWRRLRSRI
jgi:energy-coupling factor transport system permease protein